MAQGKLSSRQKMINMMYLVLLAMLALNVSPEVLDAFSRVREQLKLSAEDVNMGSLSFVNTIKAEIDREIKNEGKRDNEGMKDTLDQIRRRTQQMLSLIAQHDREMGIFAKYDPEKKDFTFKDETEKNYQYWMGDEEANDRRGSGEAYSFRDSIDNYYEFLTDIYNNQMREDSLKIEARQVQDPKEKSKDKKKRWEQYTFEGPVIGNMATLEALKLEMLKEEKKVLDLINTRFTGGSIYIPDRISAISAPISQIVPAGLPFQSRVFIGMESSQVKPKFGSANGRITLDENGNSALFSMMANGNVIPNGKTEGTQSYQITVQVPKATGGYEELTINQNFTVRKPEVLITSAAIQNLYYKCGNTVNIDVPALGNAYDPVIEATRAKVQKSSQSRKRFMIIPEGRETVVSVSSRANGQVMKIDRVKYNVIAPPKPSVEIFVNNRPYSGINSIKANSKVEVRLKADTEFAKLMPSDAKYRISQVEILLKSGLSPARVVKTLQLSGQNPLNKINLRMSSAIRGAREGDKVFIRIKEISRVNFRGEAVPDRRFSELELTTPLAIGR